MKVYGQLDSAQLENLGSDPSKTPYGRIYFHTSLLLAKIYTSLGWANLVARRVSGSRASPNDIVLATGVVVLLDGTDQVHFVKCTGGGSISAISAISDGLYVGQKLTLKGRSDTDYLIVPNGANTSQNGDMFLGEDNTITYTWDGTNWSEDSRR